MITTPPSPQLPTGATPISIAEAMDGFSPRATYHPYVWVTGEISDFRRATSGHAYFTLSDGMTQIPCVLWERVARGIPARAQDGHEVAVFGWIQKHPKRSHLEMDVRDLVIQSSKGPQQQSLDDLRATLAAEGLFSPERKRRLPEQPRHVGIVTSPSGDVIHDIQRVLQRRAPGIRIQLAPVRVTGEGAAVEIATAIRSLSESAAVSPIIIARGGGSTADLAAFNTAAVARAIAGSRVPVVSAVGHEPDITLADLAADVRCATPSEAAELITPHPVASELFAQGIAGGAATELHLQFGAVSITMRLRSQQEGVLTSSPAYDSGRDQGGL